MNQEHLTSLLKKGQASRFKDVLVEEHLQKLANTLQEYKVNGVPEQFPKPHFNVECTPPLKESFQYFKNALLFYEQENYSQENLIEAFKEAFRKIPVKNILILLGQRFTPASITDKTAFPPLQKTLLQSAFIERKQGLSIAARAWTKHVGRSKDSFWGEIKGSAQDKNNHTHKIVLSILENTTWWNIFFHYKHELVYEARIKSGHGLRWAKKGKEFIGFLEPFLEPELQ